MSGEAQLEKLPIAVVFLTRNEEFHLPGALANVLDWASEVFVVDSLSTDNTVQIALDAGVHVVQRRFRNFGDQWNFALDLPIQAAWTLKLDPDERLEPALIAELRTLLAGDPEHVGYAVMRRLWFLGQPLHVMGRVERLWRTGVCRFSDVLVNERPLIDGSVGMLRGRLEHFDSRDLHHWYEKQNRYSTMEALMMHDGVASAASTETGRARCKRWFFRLPFRYQLVWLHCMLVKGAWRDGAAGRAWAHLRQEVYRARALKEREMRITGRRTQLPAATPGVMHPAVRDTALQRLMEGRDAAETPPAVPGTAGGYRIPGVAAVAEVATPVVNQAVDPAGNPAGNSAAETSRQATREESGVAAGRPSGSDPSGASVPFGPSQSPGRAASFSPSAPSVRRTPSKP